MPTTETCLDSETNGPLGATHPRTGSRQRQTLPHRSGRRKPKASSLPDQTDPVRRSQVVNLAPCLAAKAVGWH